MRISNPDRFANRVVIPSGLILFAIGLYIDLTKTVILYGYPITLAVVSVFALPSAWLATVAIKLKVKR